MMTENEKQQLRADVLKVLQPAAAPEPLPLPSAARRETLTEAQQETLFANWVKHIYESKPNPGTWTSEEKRAVAVAAQRALKTL